MKKQQIPKKIKTKNYQRLSFLALFLVFALVLGALMSNNKESDKAGLASKTTPHSTEFEHSSEVRPCESPCIPPLNPLQWQPPTGITQPDDAGREIARSFGMTAEQGWSEGVRSICRKFFNSTDVTRCRLSFLGTIVNGDRNKESDKAGFASKTTTHSTEVSTGVPACDAPCILPIPPLNPRQWRPPTGITQPADVGREIARSFGMTVGVRSICEEIFRRSDTRADDVVKCYMSFANIAWEGACLDGQSPSDVAWNTLQANGIADINAYSTPGDPEETRRCSDARGDCQKTCDPSRNSELLDICITRLETINPDCK